jgi:hypothetical protein
MLTGITVMTLVEQVIALAIEVTASFGLLGLTVATDRTATVVQVIALAFKHAQAITNLI